MGSKKLMPFTVLSSTLRGQVNMSSAELRRRVAEGGKMQQVAAIAGKQDLTQIDQAVDRLFDEGRRRVSLTLADVPRFRWCLKKFFFRWSSFRYATLVQDLSYLDRGIAEAMLNAGPLIRAESREPNSWASRETILWREKRRFARL